MAAAVFNWLGWQTASVSVVGDQMLVVVLVCWRHVELTFNNVCQWGGFVERMQLEFLETNAIKRGCSRTFLFREGIHVKIHWRAGGHFESYLAR